MRTLTALTLLLSISATAFAEAPARKQHERTIRFKNDIGPIALSHDGKQLAVGRDGAVDVYDFKTMKRVNTIAILWDDRGRIAPTDPASIAFSPDSKRLAVLKVMPEIQLFDAKTGLSKEIIRFPLKIEELYGISGGSVVYSPGGKMVGMLSAEFDMHTKLGSDVTGYLWMIDKEQKAKTLTEIRNCVVTPERKFLGLKMRRVKSGHSEPRIVDLKTGKTRRKLELKKTFEAMESRFSKDGTRIAVAGMKRLVVWNTSNGKQVLSFKSDAEVFERGIAFSADGKHVTAASYQHAGGMVTGRIRTWRISDGKVIWQISKAQTVPRVLGSSPNGKSVIFQMGGKDQLKFRAFANSTGGK